MKKMLTTLGILVLVGFLAAPVLAHRWGRGGYGAYGGAGAGPCWLDSEQYSNLGDNQKAQLDKLEQDYANDTAKLKEEIWEKSTELDTIMNSPNPDPKKAQTLQKEISNLKAKMAEQRVNFQLEARKIAPSARFDRGYGRGYGHMGYRHGWGPRHGPYGYGPAGNYGPRGGGYGPCWN